MIKIIAPHPYRLPARDTYSGKLGGWCLSGVWSSKIGQWWFKLWHQEHWHWKLITEPNLQHFNPFAPGDFAKKHDLKLPSWAVFWSLSCYKELKLTTKPFTGRTLCGLLIQMQNISLQSLGMHRKQNFKISSFWV